MAPSFAAGARLAAWYPAAGAGLSTSPRFSALQALPARPLTPPPREGGLIALTKSLAREAGSAAITVNALAPGPVETEMLRRELHPDELTALARNVPSGCLGRPQDVAGACAFLASPDAAFINGQVLCLDGGWLP